MRNRLSDILKSPRHGNGWRWVATAACSVCLTAQAQSPAKDSAPCQQSTAYFAEFYAGLQTMHAHGLKNFVPGSADAQAYFIQVQKNGEKVEMNVLKGLRNDGTLKPQEKETAIRLNQTVARAMRSMAEQDAKDGVVRDKPAVIEILQNACLTQFN